MRFEVACREPDLQGAARVGSAMQVQGLATVNLIHHQDQPTAWRAQPSGWEPVTLHDRNPDALLAPLAKQIEFALDTAQTQGQPFGHPDVPKP